MMTTTLPLAVGSSRAACAPGRAGDSWEFAGSFPVKVNLFERDSRWWAAYEEPVVAVSVRSTNPGLVTKHRRELTPKGGGLEMAKRRKTTKRPKLPRVPLPRQTGGAHGDRAWHKRADLAARIAERLNDRGGEE